MAWYSWGLAPTGHNFYTIDGSSILYTLTTFLPTTVPKNQSDHIWRIFATKAKFSKVFGHLFNNYLLSGKIVSLLWEIFCTFGQSFILLNGQIFNKIQTI